MTLTDDPNPDETDLDRDTGGRVSRTRGRTAAGLAALLAYVGSVVLANYLTTRYGLVRVGLFSLVAPAGTFAVGGALVSRDVLQDGLGRRAVLAAIGVSAVLSYAVSSPTVARASAITFLVSEVAETVVYSPLRVRVRVGSLRWSGVVVGANLVGALFDTVLFLHLARFALTVRGVEGQLVGKAYATVAVVVLAMGVRRALSQRDLDARTA